eukprot:scaffold36185_cov101-Isochrysis_galbana.AAC.1
MGPTGEVRIQLWVRFRPQIGAAVFGHGRIQRHGAAPGKGESKDHGVGAGQAQGKGGWGLRPTTLSSSSSAADASRGACMSPPLAASPPEPMSACRDPAAFHAVEAIVMAATINPTTRSRGDSRTRPARGLHAASGWEASAE